MKEKLSKVLRIIFALIVVIVCVYYSIKDIEIAKLWEIIKSANYLWVLLSIPVILTSHWIRAVRWRRILTPITKGKGSTWNLFSSVMIGYALNGISPRGGEFIRPYTYSRREKVSYSSVFATIVVERFIDLLTLALLLSAAFIFLSDKIIQGLPNDIDTNKMIFIGVLVLVVLVLGFYPPSVRFILTKIFKPLSPKLYEKLISIFEKFVKGFAIIKSPSQYFMLIVESLLIWLFYTIPMFFMFYSFGFQNSAHLGFEDAILMIVLSGVITTISPSPGAIGLYHLAISSALSRIYSIPQTEAMAYATLTHGINYFIQVFVGGMFYLRENVKGMPDKEDIEIEANS